MKPLLQVKDLWVMFKKTPVVRGISFEVGEGESVGIVGESGSGKTATVQAINRLTSGAVTGQILFDNQEAIVRGKDIGMVFQDPMTSLNPTMKIGAQIAEGLIYHKMASRQAAKAKALELLRLVGIPDPELRLTQYPHELSGGMRQRVLIAIAIACHPRLLIADEATTALDATTQAQVLDLIKQMRAYFNMSLLVISHDFGVIASLCEKVLVMYGGEIVESGPVQEVLTHPRHPYTKMLLSALLRNP
jgi:ABC-type dipeptide/oligopeptide/nickel transport system ATPase component